jgi:hypothetical protein
MTDKKTDLERWDSELKDDFDSIADADAGEGRAEDDEFADELNEAIDSDGEPIEFDEDESAVENEPSEPVNKKKSKLPLIAASSLVLIAAGYVVIGQTGLLGKKKIDTNHVASEAAASSDQLNIDINRQESSKQVVTENSGEFQLNQGTLKSSVAQAPEVESAKELKISTEAAVSSTNMASVQDNSLVINASVAAPNNALIQHPQVNGGVAPVQQGVNNTSLVSQQVVAITPVLSNSVVPDSSVSTGVITSNIEVAQNPPSSAQAFQSVAAQAVSSSSSSLASMSSSAYSSIQTTIHPSVDVASQSIDYKSRSISTVDRGVVLIGRSRIPNFQIISTSADGTMSIIRVAKTSGDVVKVVFTGEIIIVPEVGSIKIVGIVDGGHLILAGDKWYVDDKMELREKKYVEQSRKSVQSKSSSSSVSSLSSSSSSSRSSVSLEGQMIIAESRLAASPQKKPDVIENTTTPVNKADGWFLGAIYNNKYLIQSPSGQMFNVQTGDSVNELGVVGKVNEKGELYIGKYIIKPQ